MTENESDICHQNAISASWERCERRHRLARNALRPILRLQSSEIEPRREELIERTGGRLGVFQQVAEIAIRAEHCFSIADSDGILVRREGKAAATSEYESNGIALGSCWDERIGGTNGVSMALAQKRPFTVRGPEHYFSKLTPFACTGVPLHDAENQMIGVVNLAIVDRGNAADYLFSQQLLGAAADRIQRVLFERHFRDAMLVTVSSPTGSNLLQGNELVAVDETGLILGSTSAAHQFIGLSGPSDMVGRSFEELFGSDAFILDRSPEHIPYVRTGAGRMLRLSRRLWDKTSYVGRGWQAHPTPTRPAKHRSLPLSIRDLAAGSTTFANQCARAEAFLQRSLPFVIQGGSGTGKTTVIAALQRQSGFAENQIVTVDCAVLDECDQDKTYVETMFEQARIASLLGGSDQNHLMLVFDNVDEMPNFAQAALRNLLQELEEANSVELRSVAIIATTRKPLIDAVRSGAFREDLYYLLANAVIALPAVSKREKLDVLIQSLAARLAGDSVEFSNEAMAAIRFHAWPGNVRELRSVLQQALIDGDGRRISLINLQSSTLFSQGAGHHITDAALDHSAFDVPYSEKNKVLDALVGAKWNVSQAARTLGIGRATIHRKMKQFNITRPS